MSPLLCSSKSAAGASAAAAGLHQVSANFLHGSRPTPRTPPLHPHRHPPRPPAADNDGFLVQYQGYSFLRFFGACTNPTLGYSSQPSAVSSFDECAAQCHATRWCSSFVWTHESSTSCVLLHGHSYPPMPTVGTTITTEVSDDYSDGRAGDMVTDDND